MSKVEISRKAGSRDKTAISLWFFGMMAYPIIAVAVIYKVDATYGSLMRVLAGILSLFGFFVFLKYFYRWGDRHSIRWRAFVRENYRGIYRVKGQPASQWTWMKENIQIGDYGWERPPWRDDGLIYLHGLQEQWGMVWKAGFRPEDVEYVTAKPISEFDWRDFEYDGSKPKAVYHWGMSKSKSVCPYPVDTDGRHECKWGFPV